MNKSQVIGLIRYAGALAGSIFIIATSVMLIFEAPTSSRGSQSVTPTVATLKRAVDPRPLPQLKASDFDISRTIKVVPAARPEPQTSPAPTDVASAPAETEARTATVTADAVNLRAAASKASARVYVVRAGTRVTVLETERSWTKVLTEDGISGWLATKFLSR
ncbi:MAG TPA: SH3 domain-containing protein [Devosia sp.]